MIIDGKKIAEEILQDLKKRLKQIPFQPVLCDVLVGEDPVSLSYVKIKEKTAARIGIEFNLLQLPKNSSTGEIVAAIAAVQNNPRLCGLIVQLPLPEQIDRDAALSAIGTGIDVDVINPESNKQFYLDQNALVPPTAGAILYLLDDFRIELVNPHFLVIGQGELVGKPITHLLRQRGYTVTTADSATTNLPELTKAADVIISGAGQEKLITGPMIKQDAIVIDAGTSESGTAIVGDVDLTSVKHVADIVSPVPGGVGPVTVAKLLENVVRVAEEKTLS